MQEEQDIEAHFAAQEAELESLGVPPDFDFRLAENRLISVKGQGFGISRWQWEILPGSGGSPRLILGVSSQTDHQVMVFGNQWYPRTHNGSVGGQGFVMNFTTFRQSARDAAPP